MSLDAATKELGLLMKGLTLKSRSVTKFDKDRGYTRATREPAGFGSVGAKIQLAANHFPMKLTCKTAYHYDVSIEAILQEPEKGKKPGGRPGGRGEANRVMPKPLVRRVLQTAGDQYKWPSGWACDWGKNIYCPGPFLDLGMTDKVWEQPVRVQYLTSDGASVDKTYKVTIKFAAAVDMEELQSYITGNLDPHIDVPRAAIQVLEVVMRSGVAARETVQTIGNSVYFNVPNNHELHMNLGGGAEAWAGYKQAVKPCQFGLSFNIDLAATAFMSSGPLPTVVANMLNLRGGENELSRSFGNREHRTIKTALKGLRVIVDRQGKKYKKQIRGVGDSPANRTMFWNEEQKKDMSVADYFQQAYGLKLRFANLPPVNVSSDPSKKNWQPMELCTLAPGQRRRVLNDRQTSEMLKFAGLNPELRRQFLEQVVGDDVLGGFNNDPAVKAFGIQVKTTMVEVEARLLKQPMLGYGAPQALDPGTEGAWNLRDVRFPTGTVIESWAFVPLMSYNELVDSGPTGTETFIKDLVDMLNKTGVKCPFPYMADGGGQTVLACVQAAADGARQQFGKPCQMVLVLLPVRQIGLGSLYAQVKQAGDSILKIPTQCIVAPKAGVGRNAQPPRGRPQYCANVALKINAKMGGVNVKLVGPYDQIYPVVGSAPFMVFGADVTHPTSFDPSDPSIAAVTGSYDATLGRYMARVLKQGHRQEIITGLKDAAKDMLIGFYRSNSGRKPLALIYYRDGVAEGQFDEVLREEYKALRQACFELEAGYCPTITFVVVQKRHNTRLFPVGRERDRSGNCLPGTVVDKGICHPTQFDFFLNSHAGLQGHNKPGHYHVLVDENGFTADGLQLFTYWQCFLYCRCTRSVSYVPAAYYAHLAAFRGRLMQKDDDTTSMSSGSSGDRAVTLLDIDNEYAKKMFYA